tara:strand:+ start:662 stop:859 length:198 start_codon:yes stop_codon:yes gene_type:complete
MLSVEDVKGLCLMHRSVGPLDYRVVAGDSDGVVAEEALWWVGSVLLRRPLGAARRRRRAARAAMR